MIVQTCIVLSRGWKANLTGPKASFKPPPNIRRVSVQLNIVFGAFVIIVSLLTTACSTTSAPTYSMTTESLNHYQVECSKKAEQIRFIQSMRPSESQRNMAAIITTVPFAWMADVGNYSGQKQVASGRKDWMLNQILMELNRCP